MKLWFKLSLCIFLCLAAGACSRVGNKEVLKDVDAAPQGKVTIRWRNETEHENYGFNIYRGDAKEGPFEKLNKEIIPGAGTSSTPKEYVYIDQPLEIGRVYYYYIESISFAGEKEQITPVTKVVVKNLIRDKSGK